MLVAIVFGIVFLAFAVIVVLTKVSERRLKLYSIIFWLLLVLQLYSTYAVQIHHHASTLVRYTILCFTIHTNFSLADGFCNICCIFDILCNTTFSTNSNWVKCISINFSFDTSHIYSSFNWCIRSNSWKTGRQSFTQKIITECIL